MARSDVDARFKHVLGSPEFAHADRRARVIAQDPAALRALVVDVERVRGAGQVDPAYDVARDIACAMVEARAESLDEKVPAGPPDERLQVLLSALLYLVQTKDGTPTALDDLSMLRWAIGSDLQGVIEPG